MRSAELAKRNVKEMLRDPMSLSVGLALPIALLLVLQSLGGDDAPYLTPTLLTPGIVLFGFVMLMFSSALILARDRENALLARFFTTPLQSSDFVAAYSLPYVVLALVQAVLLYTVGGLLGLGIEGSVALVAVVMALMSVLYIGLGMILGTIFSVNQAVGAYTVVLLLTIFGGTWMDLDSLGGPFQTVGDLLPFAHALQAVRDVMVDGAGFGDIATDLSWVVGYTLVTAVSAVVVFRSRMVE